MIPLLTPSISDIIRLLFLIHLIFHSLSRPGQKQRETNGVVTTWIIRNAKKKQTNKQTKTQSFCYICFHVDEHEYYSLVGYDAMQPGRNLLLFRRNKQVTVCSMLIAYLAKFRDTTLLLHICELLPYHMARCPERQ